MVDFKFGRFNSVIAVINFFHSDEECMEALIEARWGDDVVCPHCGQHHCKRRTDGRFRCNKCKHNFSCTTGTIFANTKLPLQKWFVAMYLVSSHKKGVSSCQIMRDCDVCQKTAWFMLHKIRGLFGQTDGTALKGEVEMDEMYLGGSEVNKHESKRTEGTQGRSTKTKTPIFGMLQRDGKVVAIAVDDTKRTTLIPIVEQFVEDGTTTYTDEASIYNSLSSKGYKHERVNHSKREYVRASDIHTNGIEGFWAHFKRVIFSTYHCVSKDYLQRYIDEQTFRWNTREMSEAYRFEYMFRKSVKSFDYADVMSLSSIIDVRRWKINRRIYMWLYMERKRRGA